MSDLHDLCKFEARPITQEYVEHLKEYLKAGIPATYTIEEAYNYTNGIDAEPTTTTTPLHLICTHAPSDASEPELKVIEAMVEMLLEYGAGWCLTDINNETPGCILIRRNLKHWPIYNQIVAAGIRAELLLRKVTEYDVEFIDEEPEEDQTEPETKVPEQVEPPTTSAPEKTASDYDSADAPSQNQHTYLNTKLEYRDNALVTKDRQDGVMMSWETDLMRLGCDSLFKGAQVDGELDSEVVVLNIGFGMGIIDTMIRQKKPTKQYICEAHPDVLAKLRADGWYEDPRVVILGGRWQDELNKLLSEGNVFFNGIYYDTYSEHYSDMLELFDFVVGLLKPHGVFSFFNGLGADRQVVYEVYKQLVELDLANYGLQCTFTEIEVPASTLQEAPKESTEEPKSVWDDIKRSYWSCPVYYHPEARFIDV